MMSKIELSILTINPDHLRTHPGMDGLSFMAWDLRGSPGNLFNTGRG